MPPKPIIDIHVHSTLKPYGKSMRNILNPKRYGNAACIWSEDRVSDWEDKQEDVLGLVRYRQADCNSLDNGQVAIAFVSLYPTEIGFVAFNGHKPTWLETLMGHLASSFGTKRIRHLQGKVGPPYYHYFPDLELEYAFLKLLNDKTPNNLNKSYHLMRHGRDYDANANINIVVSIEGAHVFCDGRDIDQPANWANAGANITAVKKWDHPPFYISLGHHFYNAVCTHAMSLTGIPGKQLDQSIGMRERNVAKSDGYPDGFTVLGIQVVQLLLRKNANERRILIDVKHMSVNSRNQYYQMLDTTFAGEDIPVICSHGGIDLFYPFDVNMSWTDIQRIYDSSGLMGIELDERILGKFKNPANDYINNSARPVTAAELDAYYVWRQIEKIAEYAFQNGHDDNPWKCLCLGSDYDGLINPLDSFRRADQLPMLYELLLQHANRYFSSGRNMIPASAEFSPERIVEMFMYENARVFLEKYY